MSSSGFGTTHYQNTQMTDKSTNLQNTTAPAITYSECYNQPFFKVCSRCRFKKISTDFWKDKTSKSGLRSYCKECSYEIRQTWIHKNKHKEKEYNAKYRPATFEKYKVNQLAKQENNKCTKCGCSLIGRQLLARYCKDCKSEIKKEWKKESYKRNIDTVIKYNSENRESINKKNAIREFNRRENLADRYITKLLREKNGFSVEQLKANPEIIEVKRIIIKTKRL